jgi:hypothetical protein
MQEPAGKANCALWQGTQMIPGTSAGDHLFAEAARRRPAPAGD